MTGYTGGLGAAAGQIGEVLSSGVGSGSATGLGTGTLSNILSVALSAGDWEVDFSAYFAIAATTSVSALQAGISTSSSSMPALTGPSPVSYASVVLAAQIPATGIPYALTCSPIQINISAGAIYYLNVTATFTVSTVGAFGWMKARRVR